MKDLLLQIGFEEKEVVIYLSCLEKEFNTPTDIAKSTGIKRTTIYFYLNKLADKGLVTYKIKKAKKYIQPLPPRKALLKYIERNKAKLEEHEHIIEKLPIDKIIQLKNNDTQVYYYEGREGVNFLIDEILTKKKDIFWLGSMETILSIINEERFYKFFTIKRMSQKTTSFALTDKSILKYPKFSESLGDFRAIKFLNQNFTIPGLLILYEDTICLVSNHNEIKTVVIKDELMHKMIFFLFNSYWNTLS